MNRGAQELAQREPRQANAMRALLAGGERADRPKMSRLYAGDYVPNPRERAILEDSYGVGWRLWDEPVDNESGEHAAVEPPDSEAS